MGHPNIFTLSIVTSHSLHVHTVHSPSIITIETRLYNYNSFLIPIVYQTNEFQASYSLCFCLALSIEASQLLKRSYFKGKADIQAQK